VAVFVKLSSWQCFTAAEHQLSAAPLAAVLSGTSMSTPRDRHRASRRHENGETGTWSVRHVNHRKNFPVEGGGRALAGGNGPGYEPRQRCQLHSLVGWLLWCKVFSLF